MADNSARGNFIACGCTDVRGGRMIGWFLFGVIVGGVGVIVVAVVLSDLN